LAFSCCFLWLLPKRPVCVAASIAVVTGAGVVQRPCEVVTVRPGDNNVEVQFKSGEELTTVRTQWLVGCDGMRSVVREQTSIPFIGSNYEESFVLADVEMDWPLDRQEVSLFFSDKGLVVVAPLPGNHFGIVATMKEAPLSRRMPTFSTFSKSADRRTLPSQFGVSYGPPDFTWNTALPRFCGRAESCWPATPRMSIAPAGGQGMNTGIQDAVALAAALQETLQQGNDSALNRWQEKRLAIAPSVVTMTDRMTKMATASSYGVKLLRNAVLSIVGQMAFAQHALAEKLSELENR
jgi:2-polyprenyl-6-methoxyphenol hydroxylase-like FAD-dependent oxidoreductase